MGILRNNRTKQPQGAGWGNAAEKPMQWSLTVLCKSIRTKPMLHPSPGGLWAQGDCKRLHPAMPWCAREERRACRCTQLPAWQAGPYRLSCAPHQPLPTFGVMGDLPPAGLQQQGLLQLKKKGVFQAAALPSRCHETILNVLRCASAMRNCNL